MKLENRPLCLTAMAYEWCSVICENHDLEYSGSFLLTTLELGFRHINPREDYIGAALTHTKHHQELANVVFRSQRSEAIADLLYAWTTRSHSRAPAHMLLGTYAEHLVGLHDLAPFSPRLRRLVVRSVELIGYEGFERVGVKRFIELLNNLHVTVEDMDSKTNWANLLMNTFQSLEGAQHLSHWYWELLVELTMLDSWRLSRDPTYSPQITISLTEAQEWSKLECWMGTVWMLWPPEAGGIAEEDISRTMLLLFRQRPGAAQKLEQWMGRWSQECVGDIPESFQRICKQAHEEVQRDTP